MQCMILKALGYSYDEIAARTGFSWTKVNRSLTEGRRRFFERFGAIASGTACREYQPLLSAACDGHAGEADRRLLQAHLAACQGCRATLREYRSAPARLAELLPPAVVLPLLDRAGLWSRINDWFAVTAGERATALGMKLQQGAEAVTAQKAAAVVASTAAIAGGGAAVHHADAPHGARRPPAKARTVAAPPAGIPATSPGPPAGPASADPGGGAGTSPASRRATGRPPRPAGEFGFEGHGGGPRRPAVRPQPRRAAAVAASAEPARSEFSAAGSGGGRGAGGAGEFGP
jgi:hypothetical protein